MNKGSKLVQLQGVTLYCTLIWNKVFKNLIKIFLWPPVFDEVSFSDFDPCRKIFWNASKIGQISNLALKFNNGFWRGSLYVNFQLLIILHLKISACPIKSRIWEKKSLHKCRTLFWYLKKTFEDIPEFKLSKKWALVFTINFHLENLNLK